MQNSCCFCSITILIARHRSIFQQHISHQTPRPNLQQPPAHHTQNETHLFMDLSEQKYAQKGLPLSAANRVMRQQHPESFHCSPLHRMNLVLSVTQTKKVERMGTCSRHSSGHQSRKSAITRDFGPEILLPRLMEYLLHVFNFRRFRTARSSLVFSCHTRTSATANGIV